ncbi:MAG: DNA topoisomerase 3, partial [Bacteroidota bacterium]
MKVCIAEKPSVAREIAYILGAKTKKDGYFEGNGYQVTWTFGHFCELKTPDDYQAEWKRWDVNTLPILPEKFETKLKKDKGVKKQFKIVKSLFRGAAVVINCGDAGQEGELIQRWVLQEARYRGPVQRLWISSLTPEAIREGFRQLRPAADYDRLFHAGSSRAIGDWLLGMNATRLYTLKYGGYKQVLSIGRVQTPTLAMLVERQKAIDSFVPEPYWELHTLYREVDFHYEKGRFTKKTEGEQVLEKVRDEEFVVVSFDKKKGREYPPRLFDLTSLQVHCNKRFGFSADQTLQLVQKLYERKVVTYPRVDTTYLPNDLYPKIAGILGKMQQYQSLTQSLLGKKIRKSSKVFNDKKVTDHHAIIPTGYEQSLADREQKVYDAIARQFIAAFYPDCLVANTTVIGEVAGIRFKATGKEILEPGWRIVLPKPTPKKGTPSRDQKDQKAEEKILPTFQVGERGPHEPSLVEKKTQPPKYYTEASLLRAMETAGKKVDDEELRDLMKANGIGRPSTRASIIETLFRRRYIRREKKRLLPTEVGTQLIDTIQNELLKSAELTGRWEKQLREIEGGTFQATTFVQNMKQMVTDLVTEVRLAPAAAPIRANQTATRPQRRGQRKTSAKTTSRRKQPQQASTAPTQGKAKRTVGTQGSTTDLSGTDCPKCRRGQLLKGSTAYGCSRWREDCQFRLPFQHLGKKLSEKQLARLLAKGATVQLKGFVIEGVRKTGKLRFDPNYELHFEEKPGVKPAAAPVTQPAAVPDRLPCPRCGEGQILKGKTAYGCSRWREGCTWRYDFVEVKRVAAGRA